MKKINNLEFSSLIVFIIVSTYSGININIIKNANGINSYLVVILSYIIGIIPILLYLYISKYKEELSLTDKINNLFKKNGTIINVILTLIIFTIAPVILYNSNNFIISQLLYRTPALLINILIILLAIYHNSKGIISIVRVSFILLVFNIIVFVLSSVSLSSNINIDNFLPILKENNNNILLNSIKITSITTLPIILTLIIPKTCLTNPSKFRKNVIISYIIGSLISFVIVFTTFGVLGINLVKLYEYPEYIVLKKVKLFDFLERIENIISNLWIIGNYIYITIIMYYINESLQIKNTKNKTIVNLILGVLIILSTLFIKNNTIFHNYIKNIFPYITMSLIIFYILIAFKILLNRKNSNLHSRP